ncbi:MAG: GGDEF domain-containing protein [Lachnospiraceae bacterium]|nr:GGDEF domain-containing protein [Lachnospiraceae bacterium]
MKAVKRFFSFINNIITGKEHVSQQRKLETLSIAITLIHFAMLVIFVRLYMLPMIVYNLIVVFFYIYVFQKVHEGQVLKGYILTFIEIAIQVVYGTFMLGWGVGYHMYLVAIIPVFYFVNLTYDVEGAKLRTPLIAALVAGVIYFTTYGISLCLSPTYELTSSQIHGMYLFNTIPSVFLLVVMSHLFILERRYFVSSLTKQNESLGKEASEDPLTGLNNRRSMEIRLENAMARAKERGVIFSLIMGDIDNFKKINDTYGHDCGDEALKDVSAIMQSSVRDGDTVCRWGGEEFLILVTGNRGEAVTVAERIRQRVSDNVVRSDENEVRFTITFGVTTYKPGYNIEKLIEQADNNLYIGKNSGKNQVVSKEY